jgi:glycosyltransferase A (GT-A) superfamily protein (DUF2064 family)
MALLPIGYAIVYAGGLQGYGMEYPQVLAHTLARIPEGCTHYLLPTLSDIDTEADWLNFGSHLRKA